MLKNKGGISFYTTLIIIAMSSLVIISFIMWPKLMIIKDTLFDILGFGEKKCEISDRTFNEYDSELTSFFKNPNRFKTDITKNDDIIKKCSELKSCFPEEYSSFEKLCTSLKSYQCRTDSLCKIISDTPCYCHTSGSYATGEPPEICKEGQYCYPKGGCYNEFEAKTCKEHNSDFELPLPCKVNSVCQVKNALCSCHTRESKKDNSKLPSICTEGQFCYDGDGNGCSDMANADKCKKTNLQFEQPPDCTIDSLCKISSAMPCTCRSSSTSFEICTEKEPYCYPNGRECDDEFETIACQKANTNFKSPLPCEVNSVCQVKNALCSCHTRESKKDNSKLPSICTEGQFCYDGDGNGCSDMANADKCKKTNPEQFEQPPDCTIDPLCKISSAMPCTCRSSSTSFEICTEKEPYCYPNGEECGDKFYAIACKEHNLNFKLPPRCEVNNMCQVEKVPCFCHTSGSKNNPSTLPDICTKGQFCYDGSSGCDDIADGTKVGQCSS